MKKSCLLIAGMVVGASMLTGCSSVQSLGSTAPPITNNRDSWVSAKTVKTQDISNVIAFVKTLNDVDGNNLFNDYTTSYDAETNTVYVSTKQVNLAFKLDENGDILFVSSNGAPEIKAAMNQNIAKVYMESGISNEVEGVFNKFEETQWLNDINCNVIRAAANQNHTPLDTTLIEPNDNFEIKNYTQSDLEKALADEDLKMPVLTEKLTEYGVEDLTDYYETPSLDKYWNDGNKEDIQGEITDITDMGSSIKDKYNGYLTEKPMDLTLPDWKLEGYTLPSQFSDKTPTKLGTATLDAFNDYQSDLSDVRDALWEKEENAQKENNDKMQSLVNEKNQEMKITIAEKNNATNKTNQDLLNKAQQQQQQNQQGLSSTQNKINQNKTKVLNNSTSIKNDIASTKHQTQQNKNTVANNQNKNDNPQYKENIAKIQKLYGETWKQGAGKETIEKQKQKEKYEKRKQEIPSIYEKYYFDN